MRDGGLATDTEDVTRAGRGDQPLPARVRGHYIVDQTRLVQHVDLLTRLKDGGCYEQILAVSPSCPVKPACSPLAGGRQEIGGGKLSCWMSLT